MAHFHGAVTAKHVHGDGSWSSAPTIGTITPAATSATFTYSGPTTHYRAYPISGSPGAWVVIGASPVTVSGLAANTPHRLDISGDGSTVADTEDFGTLNPGGGGGEIDPDPPIVPTVTLRIVDKAEAGSRIGASTNWDFFWYDTATKMAEAVALTPTVSFLNQSVAGDGVKVLTLTGSTKASGESGFLMFSNGARSFAAVVEVD